MKFAFLILISFLLLSAPAFAGKACYTPEEMNAEQWLRLHSGLMVITVTCQRGSQGQDLPSFYGRFTQKYLHTLHDAEQTMMGYYKRSAKGDPTDHLDRLRTVLANEYSQKVADMSAKLYCAINRDKVEQETVEQPQLVAQEVQQMQTNERSFAPLCGAVKNTGKKGD